MLRAILRNAGIHPRRLLKAVRGWPRYVRERKEFRRSAGAEKWPWSVELPVLTDWNESSGSLGAYFFQDQLVARWVHETGPVRHVDVGSRLDGFVGSLSVFREVEVIDIRPQPRHVRNIRFHLLDLMRNLPQEWVECTDSLSCLHTIEHFGLGRYGDDINPDGHLKGIEQLKRMVAPGGTLYLSTPMGPQRIEFNAHRVFPAGMILSWFAQGWTINRFSYIDDTANLHENVEWRDSGATNHFGCHTGVAILSAVKNPP